MNQTLPTFVDTVDPIKLPGPGQKLVPARDPILRTPAPKFNFADPPINPVELYNTLGEAMLAHNGVGLTACQIGLPYNAFVLRTDPVMAMFNAEIVDASPEKVTLEEGCLSFPGVLLKVERAQVIRVRYSDPLGNRKTAKFQDITARIIQHELDHVNGIPFGNRVSRLSLEQAIKKARKQGFKYLIGDLL